MMLCSALSLLSSLLTLAWERRRELERKEEREDMERGGAERRELGLRKKRRRERREEEGRKQQEREGGGDYLQIFTVASHPFFLHSTVLELHLQIKMTTN